MEKQHRAVMGQSNNRTKQKLFENPQDGQQKLPLFLSINLYEIYVITI